MEWGALQYVCMDGVWRERARSVRGAARESGGARHLVVPRECLQKGSARYTVACALQTSKIGTHTRHPPALLAKVHHGIGLEALHKD